MIKTVAKILTGFYRLSLKSYVNKNVNVVCCLIWGCIW